MVMQANPFARAQFVISCADLTQLPRDDVPEVAFAGRSNAGKSSALNTLSVQNHLARVSKTPGRTQLINLFEIAGIGRFADLPGYGYAKVPLPIRRSWGALIGSYVEMRNNLRGIVLIMDIRHPLTDFDTQMLAWAQVAGRPCHILLTKADKLGYGAAKTQLIKVRKTLADQSQAVGVQLFSAETRLGLEEAVTAVLTLLGHETGATA
ncbi:MAG: ribosome biogenesis GTP-binding protein YihA/YsxC [Stenotrophobium sp.]